jgi:hypothetical protein|tara:strand:+ start:13785 stop:14060 length:276 start_codon:yes stop_codon:yes gene_type:complete
MHKDDRDRILDQLRFVMTYVGDTDDWVTVKKQMLLGIPSNLRKNFSTRDSKTKEQWLNDFEEELINYYEQLTGVRLMLRTLAERRELFGVL